MVALSIGSLSDYTSFALLPYETRIHANSLM